MLRIVGGALSGRRFNGPATGRTRPTSERVREAVCAALEARDHIAGAHVWDLYAGSGALGFEALSRGATHALLVEEHPRMAKDLAGNAKSLGLSQRCRILRTTLGRPLALSQLSHAAPAPPDLLFVDPPYAQIAEATELLAQLRARGLLATNATIVLEHAHKNPPVLAEGFVELARYRYGDTAVKLWGRDDEESES